jgi:hypothetical protein
VLRCVCNDFSALLECYSFRKAGIGICAIMALFNVESVRTVYEKKLYETCRERSQSMHMVNHKGLHQEGYDVQSIMGSLNYPEWASHFITVNSYTNYIHFQSDNTVLLAIVPLFSTIASTPAVFSIPSSYPITSCLLSVLAERLT